MRIDYWDIMELAAHMVAKRTGEDVDELCNDCDKLYDAFFDTFGMDTEQLEAAVRSLIYFTPVLESPLTKERYHCFGVQGENSGFFTSIVKVEAKE